MPSSIAGVNVLATGFLDVQHADDERHQSDDYRIPQAVVNVALEGYQRESSGRQEAAEPAIADMVRQRHRRIADAGWKHLDQ